MALIKAVLFDFAGTLVEGSLDVEGARRSAVDLLRKRGHVVSLRQYARSVERVLEELKPSRRLGFELPYRCFQTIILSRLGIPVDRQLLDDLEMTDYRFYDWRLREGMQDTLDELSLRYALGVVSNGRSRSVYRVLSDAHLAHLFRSVSLSSEVGYRKPRPEIFIAAAEALGIIPEEAVFVGDSFALDIVGATRVGMKTIWLGDECLPEKATFTARCMKDVPRLVGCMDERKPQAIEYQVRTAR